MGESSTVPGHAFLSYVREDAGHVDRLQREFEAAGITVWRDTADLWPGQDWEARIRHAITGSALVFVACFSQRSVSRPRTYQSQELTLAVEQLRLRGHDQDWLIPVRFDECEIPRHDIGGGRQLSSIQCADLFGPGANIATTRLVVAIVRILDHQARAARPGQLPTAARPAQKVPRADLISHGQAPGAPSPDLVTTPDPDPGPWRFPHGHAITIACAKNPQSMLDQIPYSNADDPDYIKLLRYSDLDALIELHGHIRALNPASPVRYCTPGDLTSADYQSHLVALGGIDWNTLTRMILDTGDLPVRQVADWSTDTGQYFEVEENGATARYRPVLSSIHGHVTLHQDVALIARSASRFSHRRTITVCCGMYAPGTFGVILALTDKSVRARNIGFLQSRFGGSQAYFVLTRIPVIHGQAVPPDWTLENNILRTWPNSPT